MTDTVGFVRKLPHQLVEAFKSTLEVVGRRRPAGARRRRVGARPRASTSTRCATVLARDRRRRGARAARVQQGRPRARRRKRLRRPPRRVGRHLRAHRRGHRRAAASRIGDRLRALTTVVELLVPYDRGDVLAAVHREGEVLVEEARRADGMRLPAPGSTTPAAAPAARSSSAGSRHVEQRTGRPRASGPPAVPLRPPRRLKRVAERHRRRRGRPLDRHAVPTRRPTAVAGPWRESGAERGYPPSIGTPRLPRGRRRLDAPPARRARSTPPAWRPASAPRSSWPALPQWLRLRTPDRDTVLYPAISYPTYAMGATLAGCRAVPVPVDDQWRLDLDADRPGRRRAGPVPVGELPGQPDRRARRPRRARRRGAGPTACRSVSDECYVEFTWDGPPRTILEHGADGRGRGALAVEAVEPRRRPRRLLRRRPRRSSTTCPRCASTPASWCPVRCRPRRSAALDDDEHVERAAGSATAAASTGMIGDRSPRSASTAPSPGRRVLPVGRRRPTATPGRSPSAWPPTAGVLVSPGRVLRRRPARATCASPSCSPTTDSSWWVGA